MSTTNESADVNQKPTILEVICSYVDNREKQNRSLITISDKKEWQRVHDEASKLLRKSLIYIIGVSIFCITIILQLEISTFSIELGEASTKIISAQIPLLGTLALQTAFISVAPLILLVMGLLLLISSRQVDRLVIPDGKWPLPFLFNVDDQFAQWTSRFILYWLVPTVLTVYSIKTSNSFEGKGIYIITASSSVIFSLFRLYWFKWTKPYRLLALVHYISIWVIVILATLSIIDGFMELSAFMEKWQIILFR